MATQLSVLSAITAQLEELIQAQGFTVLNIGVNVHQAEASRYSCDIHYDDAFDGTKCSLATGPSIAKAINTAFADSLKHRASRSLLVDEAA